MVKVGHYNYKRLGSKGRYGSVITFRVRRSRGEMYIGYGRLCVCVSVSVPHLAAFPHYWTDPDVTWRMLGVPSSCEVLGGFAIGARVSLL